MEASTPIVKSKRNLGLIKNDSIEDGSTKTSKSESDLSSADEYLTVGSGLSDNSSTHSLSKDIARNEKQMKGFNNEAIAAIPTKNMKLMNGNNMGKVPGKTILTNLPLKSKGSLTNLKMIDTKLKSSYTNLKPIGKNLPHAPSLNTYLAKSTQNLSSTNKMQQVYVSFFNHILLFCFFKLFNHL